MHINPDYPYVIEIFLSCIYALQTDERTEVSASRSSRIHKVALLERLLKYSIFIW